LIIWKGLFCGEKIGVPTYELLLESFFPVGQINIRIDGVNILVESITADEIRLKV